MNEALWSFLGDWKNIPVPVVTFVLGWFGSRWSLSKKERKDLEHRKYEISKNLMVDQHARFQEFTSCLNEYLQAEQATSDLFVKIATSGERYFYQQKITANAILSDQVDAHARDNTLVPKIEEAVHKNLPNYYDVLCRVAKRSGFTFEGKLKRENYEELYRVIEKYGRRTG